MPPSTGRGQTWLRYCEMVKPSWQVRMRVWRLFFPRILSFDFYTLYKPFIQSQNSNGRRLPPDPQFFS